MMLYYLQEKFQTTLGAHSKIAVQGPQGFTYNKTVVYELLVILLNDLIPSHCRQAV